MTLPQTESLPIFETRLAKIAEGSPVYADRSITSNIEAKSLVFDLLGPYFAERCDCEELHVVFLDTKNKPTGTARITRGTLNASLVSPREVFRPAIVAAASAIILVHNHPSGDPTPSREDIEVTKSITEAGRLIGITVLDHIVVGNREAYSIRGGE